MFRAVALLLVVLGGSMAGVASDRGKAIMMRIDSDFVAVQRYLPAGDYYLWQKDRNKLVLWSVSGRDAIEVSIAPVLRPVATADAQMFFINRDGSRRLWRYFPPNSTTGIELAVPGLATQDNQKIPTATFVSDKATLLNKFFSTPKNRIILANGPFRMDRDSLQDHRGVSRTQR
jgi:hypothetical protein